MNLKNVIFGIVTTAILVVGLGATRLMQVEETEEILELVEMKSITLTPPPEPMVIEEVQEVLETMVPPAPAFADLRPNMSLATLSLPRANQPVLPDMEVDLFSEDLAPPALAMVLKARPKAVVKHSTPKVKEKRAIGVSDLDSKPRVLRRGRYLWPRSVRDKEVRAKVSVEIDKNGYAKLLKIHSVSNSSFQTVLPKLVQGCRFSVPTYKGESVKVAYTWNLILQKP